MKKEKHRMEVYLGDNLLSTQVNLTKKDYTRILAELTEHHLKNSNPENEFYTEHRYIRLYKEDMHYTRHLHHFEYGTSEIILIYDVTDDGYRFTN